MHPRGAKKMDTLEAAAEERLTVAELRQRMARRGIREYELAAASQVQPSNLAAMLRGRAPIGERVREKIEAGIVRLGLDEDTAAAAAPSAFEPPTFRMIRGPALPLPSTVCDRPRALR